MQTVSEKVSNLNLCDLCTSSLTSETVVEAYLRRAWDKVLGFRKVQPVLSCCIDI